MLNKELIFNTCPAAAIHYSVEAGVMDTLYDSKSIFTQTKQ